MRILLLALLLLLIDWFAFQAVSFSLHGVDPVLVAVVTGAYWCVPVCAIFFVFASMNGWTMQWPKTLKVIVAAMIFILYFSKLLIGVTIIIEDLWLGIAWLVSHVIPESGLVTTRTPFMSNLGLAIGLVPLLTLTYGLIRNPYRYKVFKKDILLPNLPAALEGLRIVQISDIHAGSLLARDRVRKSIDMINALKPDIVFFTGDLVNNSADEVDAYIDIFREIKSRHGIYSVLGNHDYGDYRPWPDTQAKQANFEKLKTQHRHLGWDLLLNAHRTLNIGGSTIGVIGVENYSAHPRFQKYGDMTTAVAGMDNTDLTILLSHDPSHWDDEILSRYPRVDLTLSGHTHGFQFGIEFEEVFKWSPVQYFYKRWAGLYREGQQYLYINRGLGFLGYPGRVGILPEITLLTTKQGQPV